MAIQQAVRGVRFVADDRKVRSADCTVEIEIDSLDLVRGRIAVLIDDVVSTGSTIRKACRLLLDAGAARTDLYVTHMLSSVEDTTALCAAGIARIVSTDSVRHPRASPSAFG